ncbi:MULTISPECIES: hypothetical protein [Providencia]|uniref:Uncharacterized protein n=2 Tax=Providencia rettgeri TaxID=587 RepID=A0A379FSZ1_PRORE|nr:MULTISPECIES: hypothetical protein [Providencia]EJD6378145.1 hypothetical protein [Providencia rettgeri]EJF7711294.1 hypothetical protein [Providencia rettgeri]ELR5115839.1 hypothetical protein [Providencia rettgeri]ELR5119267.1 hypothetical protein [Providencia rettgeri]MBI6201001.1 hypothetical protein [Providencia rettgeri]
MNYQVAQFWIYSGKLACFIVISVFFAFFSVSGFMLYLFTVGIVWAVVVSFKIHGMKEKGIILKNSDVSDWMVYVNGIPVQERRQTLSNPCFATIQHAKSFFSIAFIIRALIQIIFCVYLFWQIDKLDNIFVLLFGLITTSYIVYSLWQSIQSVIILQQNKIISEELFAPSGSRWYRVFFKQKEKLFPALDNLFII